MNLRKEYVNMTIFKISILLLKRAEHFDILNAFLPHHIEVLHTFKYGSVFVPPCTYEINCSRSYTDLLGCTVAEGGVRV